MGDEKDGTNLERMNATGDELCNLISHIAKSLVDDSGEVKVSLVQAEAMSVIELSVSKSDIGKVIGKQGRTAKALRTILNGAATKLKRRVVLEILE